MRLNSADAPVGHPLSMSLGLLRTSITAPSVESVDEAEKANSLAAEFARARAEGYSAGMDDASLELEERKEALDLQAMKKLDELETFQEDARRQVNAMLEGLEGALAQASQLVEPAALELATLILGKVLGQRIENAALAQDVILAAAAIPSVPPLIIRVGSGLAEHCSEDIQTTVVDSSLGAFECVVESARGGACISPARRLRAIFEPLLASLEAQDV